MTTGYFCKTSADASAPVLTGVAGSGIPVLDFVLDVTNPSSNWEKVFSGTNKAVYRAKAGERRYIRVDDSGTNTMFIRCYESMTDVDTGTDPFPTVAQRAASVYFFVKSSTANATSRAWVAVGDSRFFILTSLADGNVAGSRLAFGEATLHDAADAYPTLVLASGTTGLGSTNSGALFASSFEVTSGEYNNSLFWARSSDGAIKSSNGGHSGRNQNGFGCSLTNAVVMPLRSAAAYDLRGASFITSAYERGSIPYLYTTAYTYSATISPVNTEITFGARKIRYFVGDTSTNILAVLLCSDHEPGRP